MDADKRTAPVVLFDLGGVVVDVDLEAGRRRWAELTGDAAGFDRAFFDSGVKARMDIGEAGLADSLAAVSQASGVSPSGAAACWNAVLGLRPEVSALVHEVAEQARCAVISNTDPVHAAWIEANTGIAGAIEQWIYSYDVGSLKPAAPIFLAALERMGVRADEAILLDDRPDNVAAARAIGIDAIEYTTFAAVRRALSERGLVRP